MSNAQTTIELNKFIKKFNSDLKKFLPKSTNTLNKSINYSILAGGKRFRPFLIYTFAKVLKVSPSTSIKIGIAVEMLPGSVLEPIKLSLTLLLRKFVAWLNIWKMQIKA